VFGMLWGLIFLHEPVTASMLAACAVILLGTALATSGSKVPARQASCADGVSRL
jgi:drug/metabolite transporter (DMT)-like permease